MGFIFKAVFTCIAVPIAFAVGNIIRNEIDDEYENYKKRKKEKQEKIDEIILPGDNK